MRSRKTQSRKRVRSKGAPGSDAGLRPFYQPSDYRREAEIPESGEPEPYRSEFRRDYGRIIHSPVFRRLQRKTQLFPGDESDFFRNRLTHSLEVAQIAKSLAIRLNYNLEVEYGEESPELDLDLVEFAGLSHDLGHPPFGHTGEYALQACMHKCGGFEGNAQTLRILTRLEKRQTIASPGDYSFTEFRNDKDLRAGINPCFRSIASILKYDNAIPVIGPSDRLIKGYYASEAELVAQVKRSVLGEDAVDTECAVIEMQIMDIADDIAYSTYDLEDALKAGFGSPLELLHQLSKNESLRDSVGKKLFRSATGRSYPDRDPSPDDLQKLRTLQNKMLQTVIDVLQGFFGEVAAEALASLGDDEKPRDQDEMALSMVTAATILQRQSQQISQNGYVRAQFTSDMIGRRVRDIDIVLNEEKPCLSGLTIPDDTRFTIDVLKHVTYELHIKSPRLKLIEYRGQQIVHELFEAFKKDKHSDLLPNDWRERMSSVSSFKDFEEMRARLICDYIAGMTDAYALDVYARLRSTNPTALFRPY